jgi:hypothetical protein
VLLSPEDCAFLFKIRENSHRRFVAFANFLPIFSKREAPANPVSAVCHAEPREFQKKPPNRSLFSVEILDKLNVEAERDRRARFACPPEQEACSAITLHLLRKTRQLFKLLGTQIPEKPIWLPPWIL